MKNSGDNVFRSIPCGQDQHSLFVEFLGAHDFSANSRRAFRQDIRKFARWFAEANREPFTTARVTTRDVQDFKNFLRRELNQAVATVNRCLVTLRRYFGWLHAQKQHGSNPAAAVKELRQQQLAPLGLERPVVRKLLREVEIRRDVRAGAIFNLFLFAGPRCSDVVNLELSDLMIAERTGSAVLRQGKGNKQRSVPLPLPVRRALQTYLESRPPVQSDRVFIGERGPITARGIRNVCDKYAAIIGTKIYPHLLRHTFSHQYLEANPGDLVGLAQILGHENLNTTKRYTQRTEDDLRDGMDRMEF